MIALYDCTMPRYTSYNARPASTSMYMRHDVASCLAARASVLARRHAGDDDDGARRVDPGRRFARPATAAARRQLTGNPGWPACDRGR